MPLLEHINSPADLKGLSLGKLEQLSTELRQYIIDVVTQIGGHFGSSLGAVELTVALHHVFDTPQDLIVWDVGHQTYGHKVLTGRREALKRIRQTGGISGFPNRAESPYDTFGVGHAGTSISAALGFASARDLRGETCKVVAVTGDGALTSGIAYEGLNNAGASNKDLVVILNDNRMSISPNVGALSLYLTKLITDPTYNRIKERVSTDPIFLRIKEEVWELTGRIPAIGKNLRRAISRFEEGVKGLLVPGLLFEELGFRYIGPIDGHDIGALVGTLTRVREMKGPILLHVQTIKGKGAFQEGEEDPFAPASAKYHAISAPKPKATSPSLPRYQDVFGEALTEFGRDDPRICGITAAMAEGTGLDIFRESFPDRFFDVGIAEQHAVTFAGGLALGGARPVTAIYSTFLQRAYDQVIHDIALQSIPVVFAMDRAGLVGEDGPTHHGQFDLSYLLCIPNLIVSAPKDGDELKDLLYTAVHQTEAPFFIRYPRGSIPYPLTEGRPPRLLDPGSWEILEEGEGVVLLAVGSTVISAQKAAHILASEGLRPGVLNCRFVKPLDLGILDRLAARYGTLVTVEENAVEGGFGAAVAGVLTNLPRPVPERIHLGLSDRFYVHGPRADLLDGAGLSPEAIARTVRKAWAGKTVTG